MRTHTKKVDGDTELDFNSYPDREVMFLGIPYARAKLVNNVWYQRTLDSEYRRFPFQWKVHEVTENREEKPQTDVAPKIRTATG